MKLERTITAHRCLLRSSVISEEGLFMQDFGTHWLGQIALGVIQCLLSVVKRSAYGFADRGRCCA